MKRWVVVATLFLTTSWSALEAKPPYLAGVWGGPHVAVAFQGGMAEVQFDCASGSIDMLVYPAKDGSFSAKGVYHAGSPGPVRVGQIFVSQQAIYSGSVVKEHSGKVVTEQMTLNVELEDGTLVGSFNLTQGAAPQITRCL
jgi:hypothetical protein